MMQCQNPKINIWKEYKKKNKNKHYVTLCKYLFTIHNDVLIYYIPLEIKSTKISR